MSHDRDDNPDDPNPRPFRPAYGPPTPEEIDAYLARVTRALYGDSPPPKQSERTPPPKAKRGRR